MGLYGLLVASVFGLFFQGQLETPLSWLRTVVSLPLRAYSIVWSPPPAFAATESTAANATRLRRELVRRLEDTVLAGGRSPGAGYAPRVHGVVDRSHDTLVLAASRQDVAGCHPLVTAGDRLLGFLAWEAEHGKDGAAVVRLLHHTPGVRRFRGLGGEELKVQAVPLPRRIPARIHLGELQTLRCLVEPARVIDDWPLRCALVEDPYLASRLRSSGQAVVTDDASHGSSSGRLPPGLLIGTLKIWGYPEHDIPIGLYVEPAQDAAAVCAVVLWHGTRSGDNGMVQGAPVPQPVRWMQMPGPAGPRWLVTAASGVRLCPGAALAQDGVLLGTLQDPWSGQSLALPFRRSTRPWSVLLLPRPGSAETRVLELCARVVQDDGEVVTLAVTRVPPSGLPAGYLFTGANGPHCPLGLYLGAVRPEGDRLLLRPQDPAITSPVVYVGEEGP